MSKKEQDHITNNASADWPPPPETLQPAYGEFLRREISVIKQRGHRLYKIQLIKRLREEYPLPLSAALEIVNEYCARSAPELQKEDKRGKYILSVYLLWFIALTITLIRKDNGACVALLLLLVIACGTQFIIRRLNP